MKIQNFRRLSRGDFPDAPEWMDSIFRAFNEQMIQLVSLAQGNTTFEDNFRAEVRKLEDVKNDIPILITLQRLQGFPIGVLVLKTNFFDLAFPRLSWRPTEQDRTIEVQIRFDTETPANTEVTLLIIGE